MRRHLLITLLMTALSASGAPAGAQAADRPPSVALLQPGARIRVRSTQLGGRAMIGQLTSLDNDVLRLKADETSPAVALARSSIREIEVSAGVHSDADKGAKVGAWIFGTAGAAVAFCAAAGNPDREPSDGSPAAMTLVAIGTGVAIGALLGAAVGSSTTSERWNTVEKARLGVGVGPVRHGGVAGSLTIRF